MSITRQQVQSAIQTLTEQGKPATIRAIRAYLGAGSLSTIQKYLHQPEPCPNPLQVEIGRLRLEVDQLRIEVDRLNLAVVKPLGHEVIHNTVTPAATGIDAIIQQGYRDGLTTAMIADRLNEAEILTSRGNRWTVDIIGHYAKRHGLKP